MKATSLLAALLLPLLARAETVAVYDLSGPVSENGDHAANPFSLELESSRPLTQFDLARSLQLAAADPEVTALVLDLDQSGLNLAQAQEVHRHLSAAREAGKDVWLYSDQFTNGTALLGSACNHFTLMPEAGVQFNGLYSESLYFKGMLDKMGVEADVIHIGDFKSFGEPFYRTGPSEPARRQMEELVDGLFEQLLAPLVEGRGIDREELMELIDRGTFSAREAREAGLVDALQYRTDFNATLRETYPEADFDREYGLPDLDGPDMDNIFDVFKMMLEANRDDSDDEDYVAVVVLEGAISDESIAPVRREILKRLGDDKARALVLRVDSPGGSALASEVLWEATDEWKASGRPFAVSMGGVAASGGYYVSSGSQRIFAEAATITGSIGVVGMKLVTSGAMEKLGITSFAIERGEHAGAMSMSRPFSEDEAEVIRRSMLEVYETFKKRVTDGRGERLDGELETLAGGRVYTGERALRLGLVDEIGGITEAVAWVAEQAGIDPAARLCPKPKSPMEGLFAKPEKNPEGEFVGMNLPRDPAGGVRALLLEAGTGQLPAPVRRAVGEALELLRSVESSPVQLIGPSW